MIADSCQRWRDRHERRVPIGPLIRPACFSVEAIEERAARAFVVQHHYSGTFPAARLCVGLHRGSELVGAAVFSVPMNNRAIPHWTGLGEEHDGAELGRLVLLDSVEGNGESWFLSRALDLLRAEKPGVEAVISYSDPVERRDGSGRLVKPGHVGIVYQALNAHYHGRSGSRTSYWAADGQHLGGRMLSKIRLDERGAGGAADHLHSLGAPPRRPFEEGRSWLERLRGEGWLITRRHPGNHAYVFPLSGRARARSRRKQPQAYPKIGAAA